MPPSVAIVTNKVFVFLELRIVIGGKHLAVCIDIDSGSLGLLEKHLHIFEVVPTDKNTGTSAYTYVYFGYLGMPVGLGIGFIKECHHFNSECPRLEH